MISDIRNTMNLEGHDTALMPICRCICGCWCDVEARLLTRVDERGYDLGDMRAPY
jgi:hypothetical protein